jgi:hypothetical protein
MQEKYDLVTMKLHYGYNAPKLAQVLCVDSEMADLCFTVAQHKSAYT